MTDNAISLLPYLKNYQVKGKNGNYIEAYNDREWRFLPDLDMNKIIVYETDKKGKSTNPRFTEISKLPKPHLKETPLDFNINDVTNIIVKHKEQIITIYEILYKKYGKETIQELIHSGGLSINCYENLSNNY